MKKWLIVIAAVLALLIVAGFIFRDELISRYFNPTQTHIEETSVDIKPEVIADNLVTPWSISFLPGGDMLVTQRGGMLSRIGENGQQIQIEGVEETSEGGLLGLALDPDFASNQQIYLYYTTSRGGVLTNRVDRYVLENDTVSEKRSIISDIPAASNHNGGAIAFGPDDKLYVTTGDAAQEQLAQDHESLAGKILRINSDGTIPDDNPFDNAVWSYGHRNPQGIAWDESGQLWSVEHGPSGMSDSGKDELNRITRGGNYGWPTIRGDETQQGMIAPVVHSGSDDTWAPAGLAYIDGVLYFAGLRGQALYKATVDESGERVKLERMFAREFGRLRAVTAHDNSLYFSTSNRDGRGSPAENDDKIYRTTF